MARYTKQRDRYSCGPIAILNSLRWAGIDLSYPEGIKWLTSLSQCKKYYGSPHVFFNPALIEAGKGIYSVKRTNRPTLKEIETHLHNLGAIVLSYSWRTEEKDGRHYSLLT